MIGIGVGQHHVLKRDQGSKMLLEVGDQRSPAIGGATIDDHQLIRGRIAIADDDGVPRPAAVTHGQEFNLAPHDIPIN